MTAKGALVWFRRDLRCDDHAALSQALSAADRVWCAFVFDTTILAPLLRRKNESLRGETPVDRRIDFIMASLVEFDRSLRAHGGGLIVVHGDPLACIPRLAEALDVDAVFANRDYEPAAIARDEAVGHRLKTAGRRLVTFKDQVIFERDEILNMQGKPYTVFTPYKRAWLARLAPADVDPHPVDPRRGQLCAPHEKLDARWPSVSELGFAPSDLPGLRLPVGMSGGARLLADFIGRIDRYGERRDFPAVKGPSYLSAHLRFGTLSIRALVRTAHALTLQPHGGGAGAWLSELIWREFFFMVLATHPHVAGGASFKPEYDALRWETGPEAERHFDAWREGRTGYPLVDAAMRQLLRTGYMHNRLRMVTASFLVKDLGIDWRLGEAHFAEWLNDFDFAANNGGWQWAASTGCDAQPWFRIFNPVTQSKQYDPDGRFIKRYVPELADVPVQWIHAPWLAAPGQLAGAGFVPGRDYPLPIVDHAKARASTLARYQAAVGRKAADSD
ncbi:MAG TPA: deoxyribodipyrimidine photo-lyase [Trinickia sp.]